MTARFDFVADLPSPPPAASRRTLLEPREVRDHSAGEILIWHRRQATVRRIFGRIRNLGVKAIGGKFVRCRPMRRGPMLRDEPG